MSAEELPRVIGYEFARRELLEEALTHPSALVPEPRRRHRRAPTKRGYERLGWTEAVETFDEAWRPRGVGL